MIADQRRAELQHAALSTWRAVHQDVLDRAAKAQGESAQAILRADKAIQRALQEIDRRAALVAPRTSPAHVVVADDRVTYRVLLTHVLQADERTELAADAGDGPEALAATIVTQPDVAVLDDQLTLLRGRDVAVQLRLYAPETRSIVLVDPSDALFTARPTAIDAIYPRDGDRRVLADLISRIAG